MIKYNYYGSQQWVLNDGPYGDDAFDKVKTFQNFIYFGGYSCRGVPYGVTPDLCIKKLNENGTEVWTRYYGNINEYERLVDELALIL